MIILDLTTIFHLAIFLYMTVIYDIATILILATTEVLASILDLAAILVLARNQTVCEVYISVAKFAFVISQHCCPRSSFVAITKVTNTKTSFKNRHHFTRIDAGTGSSSLGPGRDEFSRGQ